VSFPLTSTSGGLPGEKKRSLIFAEVLSIAASKVGVEMGAAAGAAAAAVRGAEGAFAAGLVGEDIDPGSSRKFLRFVDAAKNPANTDGTESTLRLNGTHATQVRLFKSARFSGGY
jgi:hypothetical protein